MRLPHPIYIYSAHCLLLKSLEHLVPMNFLFEKQEYRNSVEFERAKDFKSSFNQIIIRVIV